MTMKKSKKKIISKRLWFSLVLLAVYAVVVLSSILVMRSLLLKNAQKMGELMLQKYCNEQRQYIYHGYDYTQLDKGGWPKNATYFLCNDSGKLLYFDSTIDKTHDEFQMFIDTVWEDLVAGNLAGYNVNVRDLDGNLRSIYYLQPVNGIWAILTIPVENILDGMDTYYFTMLCIFVAGLIVAIVIAVRDYNSEKNNQRLRAERIEMEQTAHIYQKAMDSTAVSYREIYFLDLLNDKYQMVFPDADNREESGSYSEAIDKHFLSGKINCENKEEIRLFLSKDNIVNSLKKQRVLETKYRRICNNDKYEWCLITITAADYIDGVLITATMSIRSIEEMIRQEQAAKELLTLAAKRAESANRAKSEFLSRMSHDIRTPMNAILGMTSVASMNMDDRDKVADCLDKISVSGRHLLGLINDILDMSKIESGKISISEDEFNLSDLIGNLISLFDEEIRAKGQNFNINAFSIQHENVIGDEQKLQQIFVNMLGNAVKFTPEGESIVFNAVEKESDIQGSGLYEFVFEDTGIGMSPEFVERIFDPFERADDSRVGFEEGTGLGMPIAINFARIMGGDIRVESKLNVGSKFTVTLYLKINENKEAAVRENQSMDIVLESYGKLDFTGKRVLLAEDNKMNVEVMTELLEIAGIDVMAVSNGREAVDVLNEKPSGYFDLVFMDIRMPIMDGYEAAQTIRKSDRDDLKNIPIIAMSADAFADDVKKAVSAGMNGHIAKPVDLAVLQKNLVKWIKE